MSHLPHNFLTWCYTVESSNQQSVLNLLPLPPSYKDDVTNQQYVKEIERKQPSNINCCTDVSNSKIFKYQLQKKDLVVLLENPSL
ncbi:3764_t:CDS:2 [Funneliformis mosseae]|uniref:3764_t:CDS:1 n=1 Tax=Funneliformis mosseae TaxID=27381 RepID=A0A9N9HES2_FUNMO|nr:3764_t:CDS:2 [Funneliformis mosseae]